MGSRVDRDLALLEQESADAVIYPDAREMYPSKPVTFVDIGKLGDRLCGASRPGHFRGVATVVLKLFEIAQPDFAYFGRKDAQQVTVIQRMVRDLNLNVHIVVCPIVREADGLALSSRNAYLNPEERRAATALYRALQAARAELAAGTRDALEIQNRMRAVFDSEPLARLDYAEVVATDDFEPVLRVSRTSYVLVAAHLGKTRLLDNMLVEIPETNPAELVCHI